MKAKNRTCYICKEKNPVETMRFTNCNKAFCSPECGYSLSMVLINKKKQLEAKQFRAETKRRKEKRKSKQELTQEAQIQFNKFIRLRDIKLPCVSCLKTVEEIESEAPTVGGYWDAGHYKSRGASPELRFDELNCHKQCKVCNGGSNKNAKRGELVKNGYDREIVNRIGVIAFEWLIGKHEAKHYNSSDLIEIRDKYKIKFKELKRNV